MNRKPIKDTLKKEISFNQSYKCNICFSILPPTFQIDHIIPWSLSHDDSESNLQALCANCHSLKTTKEALRIIQYKKLLKETSTSLCWFCLERKDASHTCDKILKTITLKKPKTETSPLDKFKYVKKQDDTLIIKVCLYNNTIHVNHVIVKFCDEVTDADIVEAVFLSTRTKAMSGLYSIIHFMIETPYEDEEGRVNLINFLQEKDIVNQLPPRIFKDEEHVVVIYQ